MPDRKNINLTGQRLTIIVPGEEPPATGWAVRFDGAVFLDGLQVGTEGAWQQGATANSGLPANHAHISYLPI
jgi:hypothetical protein